MTASEDQPPNKIYPTIRVTPATHACVQALERTAMALAAVDKDDRETVEDIFSVLCKARKALYERMERLEDNSGVPPKQQTVILRFD